MTTGRINQVARKPWRQGGRAVAGRRETRTEVLPRPAGRAPSTAAAKVRRCREMGMRSGAANPREPERRTPGHT